MLANFNQQGKFMTSKEAYARLPADAKWSCSFGNPGDAGFCEFFRTPDGKRYEVSNGRWGDEWKVEER